MQQVSENAVVEIDTDSDLTGLGEASSIWDRRGRGEADDINGFAYHLDDVVDHGLVIEDGHLLPPRGPGLGVELDRARLEKYRIG